MRLAIACIVAAGCGRIAFDSLADSGSSTAGDASDGATAACAPFDRTLDLPGPPTLGGAAAAVWTGDRYVLILRRRAIWSAIPVSPDGVVGAALDNVIPAAESLNSEQPAVALAGSQLGLLSTDGSNTFFRIFDPGSGVVGPPVQVNVTSGGGSQGLAFTGERFIAAWANGPNVYMREVSSTGVLLSGELLESTTGGLIGSLAANATHHVACVSRTSDGSPAGVVVERSTQQPTTVTLDLGTGGICTIVRRRNEQTFAATWALPGAGKLQLMTSDASLNGAGVSHPPIAGNYDVAIAPTSQGFRLITSTVTTLDHAITRYELDANGAVTTGPFPITTISSANWSVPTLVEGSDGRSLLVVPYDLASDPYHVRLIQSCQ